MMDDVRKAEIKLIVAVETMADVGAPLPAAIYEALRALHVTCPECNAGGHACPGDGVSIPHGASDCGEHDDTPQHAGADGCRCSRMVKQYCASRGCHGGADVSEWRNRTWLDVRTGDTVKLPGTENTAYVRHAVHQRWHVDPRSSEYRPVAMEWTAVHVELTAGQQHDAAVLGVLDMDPAKPILIQLSQSEVNAFELLGGWQSRIGMTMTEVSKP